MRAAFIVSFAAVLFVLVGCQPLEDRCELANTGAPVALDDDAPYGYAAADVLPPAGVWVLDAAPYTVELTWADEVVPRDYKWVDGDNDGVVKDGACQEEYIATVRVVVSDADGVLYDFESTTGVWESSWGEIWQNVGDGLDVRLFEDADGLQFEILRADNFDEVVSGTLTLQE
jgi:hypothetical protein